MSMMLTFADAAWARARALAVEGRKAQSLQALAPLLGPAEVPRRLRLLAHRLAARLHHAAGRYKLARKQLYLAARLEPDAAEIHYEIGQAFEVDPAGCDRRALRRYRLACRLAPRDARFRAALGRALVRNNRVKRGLVELRAAAKLAPADAAVLRVVMEGLSEAGEPREAFETVAKAQFSRTPAMAKLQADAKFRLAAGPSRGPKRATRLRLAGVRADAGHFAARPPILGARRRPDRVGEWYEAEETPPPRPHTGLDSGVCLVVAGLWPACLGESRFGESPAEFRDGYMKSPQAFAEAALAKARGLKTRDYQAYTRI